jgi:hypothetical protein
MFTWKEIDQKAVSSSKQYLKAESDLIECLQLVESARVFERLGFPSLFRYCMGRLKLSESCSYALISVARASKKVPELKKAVSSGTLTLSQAKRIVSVIDSTNAADWIQTAASLPQRQLEREAAKAKGIEASPLKLVLPDRIRKKLERLMEVRSASVESAIEFAIDEALKKQCPIQKAQRNIEKKAVQPSSRPAAQGRKPIPAFVRHEVVLRDQSQCTFIYPDKKRCENKFWVQMHHLKPVSLGGADTTDNLVTLCAAHHRIHHQADAGNRTEANQPLYTS